MSGRPLTSRDLARLIGVSQSAVSRAFTPSASISPLLRERIHAAAERLGYRPNGIARSLSGDSSHIVGLVISDLRNPFYPTLLERLTQALQEAGLQTLLFNVTEGADVKQQLAALRSYNVETLIVISATVLSAADLIWAAEGRRMLLVNRAAAETDLSSIACDGAAGVTAIADHFHARGVRRVGYVGGLAHTVIARERRDAFITRIAEHGMVLAGALSAGEYSYLAGWRAALQLGGESRPEAIFFANDILATGGMDALRDELGLSIPRDMLVAGFDDIAMAAWPRYEITTIRQPVDEIVAHTLALVSARGAQDARGHEIRLPGTLVVRRSTSRG